MRLEYRDIIKYEIETIFGRSVVSHRDCLDLSAEVFRKTQKQINVNTLRRFFGLIKSEYPPSHFTLNILSEYCGFQSAEQAYQFKKTAGNFLLNGEDNFVHYFVSMFEKILVQDRCDKTFLSMIEHTIKFLNEHLILVEKFHRLVAKTKNGQDYYFEQFVHIDRFNLYYKNGLRYYLIEKHNNEGGIFTHAVLVFNYWLNSNDTKMEEHYQRMLQFVIAGENINAYVYCRYYAAMLFYAHAESRSVEDTLVTTYKYYMTLELIANTDQLFYFEYVVAEALVLTGHYNDALFYIEQFFQRSATIRHCEQKTSLQNLKLFKTLALQKTGDIAEAVKLFKSINPTDFHFTSKNYASVFYTYLTTELKKKVCDYEESYRAMLEKTGFVRLGELFPLAVSTSAIIGVARVK